MNISKILLQPVITESSTLNTENNNQYTFRVSKASNKFQIAKAVSEMYGVEILAVRTLSVKRRARRLGRHSGYKPAWKKAIVTLKAGQRIEFIKEG